MSERSSTTGSSEGLWRHASYFLSPAGGGESPYRLLPFRHPHPKVVSLADRAAITLHVNDLAPITSQFVPASGCHPFTNFLCSIFCTVLFRFFAFRCLTFRLTVSLRLCISAIGHAHTHVCTQQSSRCR